MKKGVNVQCLVSVVPDLRVTKVCAVEDRMVSSSVLLNENDQNRMPLRFKACCLLKSARAESISAFAMGYLHTVNDG